MPEVIQEKSVGVFIPDNCWFDSKSGIICLSLCAAGRRCWTIF